MPRRSAAQQLHGAVECVLNTYVRQVCRRSNAAADDCSHSLHHSWSSSRLDGQVREHGSYQSSSSKTAAAAVEGIMTMRVVSSSAAKEPHEDRGRDRRDDAVGVASEALLAPLEVIFGRTFTHAIQIALHHAEDIVRYVEIYEPRERSAATTDPLEAGEEEQQPSVGGKRIRENISDRSEAATDGRMLYRVGDYTLFSPFFCPCSAYAYRSIRRKQCLCCKHILALRLALKLEAAGRPGAVTTRFVPADTYRSMLSSVLQMVVSRPSGSSFME